ncbi:hypothetical protein PIB30_097766 [Stylosanthes scabra]|uniref:PB1-like domain-containing protein n=1 Tax=Stylosanthes scabra TaxID=79078 RepID=A0ABU6ZV29_9FABA|nr:hypothetical protein [Stylosanthes scabra]
MEEDMYVPVFHYGGRFGRDTYGVLSYVDGSVKRWPPLDIDLVSLPVLEDLLKELGYEKYEKLLWHDLSFPDLEFGLHELKGDVGINEMRGAVVMHMGDKEFHIYIEHVVDTPILVEDYVNLEESNTSDSYESAEDEAYKPPPPGYEEDDSESEVEMLKNKKPVRKKSAKKNLSPRQEQSLNEGGPSNDNSPQLSPKTAKKRNSRKYTGARRRHVLRNGNTASNGGIGHNNSGPSNASTPAAKTDKATTKEGVNVPTVDPNAYQQDSDYERPYQYESEAFNSPVSSEDEGRTAYDSFNKETEYGEVEFKVGQMFESKAVFMKALSDYFVFEGYAWNITPMRGQA